MELQTTTHRGRSVGTLRAAAALVETGDRPVRVLQVGPGLAVRYLGRLTGEGTRGRAFFKGLEALVRRLPLPDALYENYESGEIADVFAPRRIELTVVDINPKSLGVVAADLRPFGIAVTPVVGDVTEGGLVERLGLAGRFDAVVALNMVLRVREELKDRAAANLVAAAAPGGIVVENSLAQERLAGLETTTYRAVYRKPALIGSAADQG